MSVFEISSVNCTYFSTCIFARVSSHLDRSNFSEYAFNCEAIDITNFIKFFLFFFAGGIQNGCQYTCT